MLHMSEIQAGTLRILGLSAGSVFSEISADLNPTCRHVRHIFVSNASILVICHDGVASHSQKTHVPAMQCQHGPIRDSRSPPTSHLHDLEWHMTDARSSDRFIYNRTSNTRRIFHPLCVRGLVWLYFVAADLKRVTVNRCRRSRSSILRRRLHHSRIR